MDSGTQRTSLADQRYNSFMFKIQSEEISTSSELREDLKKMATERQKILKKRRTMREKVNKSLKDLKTTERELEDAEKRIREKQSQYQIMLMKEAEIENAL